MKNEAFWLAMIWSALMIGTLFAVAGCSGTFIIRPNGPPRKPCPNYPEPYLPQLPPFQEKPDGAPGS